MFTTVENVLEATGYEVTLNLVNQAQIIIESIIGRTEAEITDPSDLTLIGRATDYQAAYMKTNYTTIFEQMAVRTIAQTDGQIVLDVDMLAPYVAPLALLSLRNLSWKRTKSIKTGSIFGPGASLVPWESD